MHVELQDWENGWCEISIGSDPEEIDELIELLTMIKEDPEQHFHIDREHWHEKGVGKITFSIREKDEEHNMGLGSRAYSPGETVELSDK